jgi:hypothetical protein
MLVYCVVFIQINDSQFSCSLPQGTGSQPATPAGVKSGQEEGTNTRNTPLQQKENKAPDPGKDPPFTASAKDPPFTAARKESPLPANSAVSRITFDEEKTELVAKSPSTGKIKKIIFGF